MITRDFRKIQLVRRLMRDERYDEARLILKELQHPQVPHLEVHLTQLIKQQRQFDALRREKQGKGAFLSGLFVGIMFTGVSYVAGIHHLVVLVTIFAISYAIGSVLPEYDRRRQASNSLLMEQLNKRRSKY